MNAISFVADSLSKTLELCAFELRHNRFDTTGFMRSLAVSRYKASSERKHLKSARAVLIILDRCEALYFRTHRAFCCYAKFPAESQLIYKGARDIAIRSLILSEYLFSESERKKFNTKSEIILCDAERFTLYSRAYRFGTAARYGSINKALPEIDYICSCDEIIKKSIRLISSCFYLV